MKALVLVAHSVVTFVIAILALTLILLALTGCSHTKKIGQVGNIEFYKVQSTSFIGPTVNVIVSKPVGQADGVKMESSYGGNGLGPAVIGAGGQVGAAATVRPSRINASGGTATSNAQGGQGGEGGDASANNGDKK